MSNAMRMAVLRIPAAHATLRAGGRRPIVSRVFSAAAAFDEELESKALYGEGGRSPISEYLDLAVQGHTAVGPPPKYQVSPAVMLKCGISEDYLTFKTASYQRLMYPPYVQHQEHKVTMTIGWNCLPLNEFEKRILMEIVGPRYNPERNKLKLTSDQFGSRIENKRHLTSMLDRLVFAARKLAAACKEGEEVKAEE